jgi:hypothetical protein
LEKKLQTKDEVLAELMAEHIALKKSLEVAAKLAGIPTGESPGVELTPVTHVVISGDDAGDQIVESPEVKVSVGKAKAESAPTCDGFRPTLVGEDRDQRRPIHCVAGVYREQVLQLAAALWTSQ